MNILRMVGVIFKRVGATEQDAWAGIRHHHRYLLTLFRLHPSDYGDLEPALDRLDAAILKVYQDAFSLTNVDAKDIPTCLTCAYDAIEHYFNDAKKNPVDELGKGYKHNTCTNLAKLLSTQWSAKSADVVIDPKALNDVFQIVSEVEQIATLSKVLLKPTKKPESFLKICQSLSNYEGSMVYHVPLESVIDGIRSAKSLLEVGPGNVSVVPTLLAHDIPLERCVLLEVQDWVDDAKEQFKKSLFDTESPTEGLPTIEIRANDKPSAIPAEFDLAIFMGPDYEVTLMHDPTEEKEKLHSQLFEQMMGALKPGGKACVVFYRPSEFHYYKDMVDKSGYQVDVIKTPLGNSNRMIKGCGCLLIHNN